jgi:exodeoxyribonuclease VII small subunit
MTSAHARTAPSETAPPSFEDALKRLGQIVEQLESGTLPLEESLLLFEEGVRLARASQARLDAAERRVEELLTVDDDGNPVVRELHTPEVKA